MRFLILLISLLFPLSVLAEDVPQPRPRPEPGVLTQKTAPPAPLAAAEPDSSNPPLPRPRPQDAASTEPAAEVPAPQAPAPPAGTPPGAQEGQPAQPSTEPRIFQAACPAVILGEVEATMLPPISDDGAGEHAPLALKAVMARGQRVAVTGDVTTNCQMATALPHWADAIDGYLWARDKTHLKAINVGTSYMHRDRVTGSPNDTLSEHAFADAMDVTGFTLADGRTITVATGWTGSEQQGSRIVRFAHDAACSLFMTTLGPEANELHHDHLHVDLGCHGKACTYRLCE
ncbi:MAG TPA: extensin family protein [Devosiaceae bacterium]|jgi:hypothetical protein